MLECRLERLAPHNLDGALRGVCERVAHDKLGRIRIDGADAGERDVGRRVKEGVRDKVDGAVEQDGVDGKVDEALAAEGRGQGEEDGR